MASTNAFALRRSDLNQFLYADVGVEANGMELSVLSALARRGVDPWQEAGRLAKLPRAVAIEALASNIVAMPASLWSLADATAIAARLVGLLPPRGAGALAGSSGPRVSAKPQATPRQMTIALALLAAVVAGFTFSLIAPQWSSSVSSDADHWSKGAAASTVVPPAVRTQAGK